MRSTLWAAVCSGFLTSYALGGTVTFDPEVDSPLGGEDAVYNVFEYAQSFLDSLILPPAPPTPFGVYTTDLAFGGDNFFGGWTAPLLIGTLRIDSTRSWSGAYSFGVSTTEEIRLTEMCVSHLALGLHTEGLEGAGVVYFGVPEPATLIIVAIGGAFVTLPRRRHRPTA